MNVRGISPAAYQVLSLLSYLGGYPILWGYSIPGQGIPHSRTGVLPQKDIGPVEVLWDGDGVPPERTWDQWKYYAMEMGYPRKDMGPVEVLWDGDGVPPERTWDQWKYYAMEMGYPRKDMGPVEVLWDGDGVPPGVDKQTNNGCEATLNLYDLIPPCQL